MTSSSDRDVVTLRLDPDLLAKVDELVAWERRSRGASWSRNDQLVTMLRERVQAADVFTIARSMAATEMVYGKPVTDMQAIVEPVKRLVKAMLTEQRSGLRVAKRR